MSDRLYDGRRFRVLTFVDTMSRESPAIVVDKSLSGARVAAVLDRLARSWGSPSSFRLITIPSSARGRSTTGRIVIRSSWHLAGRQPTDNPYIEAFNGRLRAEYLDQHWFASLEEAQQLIEAWRIDDNHVRPHTALGNQTPAAL